MSLDEIKAEANLHNPRPDLGGAEIYSTLNKTFERAEHYRQHPEEKPAIIKKANELFEDWKKYRIEFQKWFSENNSTDTTGKYLELSEIQHKKFRELSFFCMNNPMDETREMLLDIQKILGEKN